MCTTFSCELPMPPPMRPRPRRLPIEEVPRNLRILITGASGTGKSRIAQRLCQAWDPFDGLAYYAGSIGDRRHAETHVPPCYVHDGTGEGAVQHLQNAQAALREWDARCGMADEKRDCNCVLVFDNLEKDSPIMASSAMGALMTQFRHSVGAIFITQHFSELPPRFRNSARLIIVTSHHNPQTQERVWKEWFRTHYPSFDDFKADLQWYTRGNGALVHWERDHGFFHNNIFYFPNEAELPLVKGKRVGIEGGDYLDVCKEGCAAKKAAAQ